MRGIRVPLRLALAGLLLTSAAFAQEDGKAGFSHLFKLQGPNGVSQATPPIPDPLMLLASHGATFLPGTGFAANTFATVFSDANKTVSATLGWDQAFVDGVGPTSLSDVQVTVNGVPAFLSFVGRQEDFAAQGATMDQINLLISNPQGTVGPVTLRVQTPTESGEATINLSEVAPAFFVFSGEFLAAIQNDGSTFVGPVDLFGGADAGRPVQPALPGDAVQLFGTGFGLTDPGVPVGQVVTVLSSIPEGANLKITVGGMEANIFFGGLAPNLAGLYQFTIEVPNLPPGEHEVVAMVNGVSTPTGVVLTIGAP